MSKRRPNLLIIVGILGFLILVGPFLVPVPPLENMVHPQQLSNPNTGHLPQEESPALFLEAILDFVCKTVAKY